MKTHLLPNFTCVYVNRLIFILLLSYSYPFSDFSFNVLENINVHISVAT